MPMLATAPPMHSPMQRSQAYLAGRWMDAISGEQITVTDPATGREIGTVPSLGEGEMQQAIDAAHVAQRSWRALLARQRSDMLMKLYQLMLDHRSDLAALMTSE